MSGAHVALLNISQTFKGKSAKLTCAEGQVSNCEVFCLWSPPAKYAKTTTAWNMHKTA